MRKLESDDFHHYKMEQNLKIPTKRAIKSKLIKDELKNIGRENLNEEHAEEMTNGDATTM